VFCVLCTPLSTPLSRPLSLFDCRPPPFFCVALLSDVLAFSALLLVLRFVRHLSLLPGLGPMLLAIVKTWQNATVILYLGAMIGFVLACAFAFQIAFGAENPNFSSISRSFMALFQIVSGCPCLPVQPVPGTVCVSQGLAGDLRCIFDVPAPSRRVWVSPVDLSAHKFAAASDVSIACVSSSAGALLGILLRCVQGFTEKPELKDLDDGVIARPASTIFSILFVLLSVVLLSLFIGTCLLRVFVSPCFVLGPLFVYSDAKKLQRGVFLDVCPPPLGASRLCARCRG
jgi:hypothetical protein